MKSIRSIITILTVILFIGLQLSSCNNKSQGHNSAPTSNSTKQVELNKETKEALENLDVKIEDVSNELKQIKADLSTKKDQPKKNKSWLWAFIGLNAVVMILCGFCLKKCVKLQRRANRHRYDIEELQRHYSSTLKTNIKSTIPLDYESLKRKVSDLEKQVRQLQSYAQSSQQTSTIITPPITEVAPNKNGYFGTPIPGTEPYFKKLLVSRDSEARFSVEIYGNKAIFKPLESSSYFGTFVSNDAMRVAIDFDGGCTPSEASSMRVTSHGEAQQKDNKWFIIKKAQIQLSR